MKYRTVLSVAGSDCSGGAGIQADLKTIEAYGLYGMSVITAVTAQNTCGVQGIYPVPPEIVAQQMDSVCTDIFPDAIKIGMLCSAQTAHVVAEKLKQYHGCHIVIDPVLISTSGCRLLTDDGIRVLTEELFPLAELITPNIPEADVLRGVLTCTECAVLVKGGHSINSADDILFESGRDMQYPYMEAGPAAYCFHGTRIDNPDTHGTGCTLSSAIACGRAQNLSLWESVRRAKEYVTGAIGANLHIGHGRGPLDHTWNR